MWKLCSSALLLGACLALTTAPAQQAGDKPVSATAPDGKVVALGKDNVINISDAQTQQVLVSLRGHTDRIAALAFSPDGRRLASGSLDKTIAVWDVPTGKQLIRVNLKAGVVSLTFSPDGRTLIATGTDQSSRRFDLATGQEVRQNPQ